jgi:hypothetical protein
MASEALARALAGPGVRTCPISRPAATLALVLRLELPALLTLLLLTTPACKKGGGGSTDPDEGGTIGYDDASSEDLAPIEPALEDDDLEGIHARGMTIWKMQRAMRLGDRAFAGFVGVTSAKFTSLAMVDPGGSSGQVAYYKWDEKDLEDGEASPDEAQKWVVVSVSFDPDEALEPQDQKGKPDGEARRSIAALQLVQEAADKEHPGARWVGYTFREQVMEGGEPTSLRQTRIYMIGADDKSPDIEYTVVDPSKRKQPPKIVESELHLPGDGTSALPLTTPASVPGPSTVARAVAIATVTEKPVKIVDASGGKWEVAPKTGELTKL